MIRKQKITLVLILTIFFTKNIAAETTISGNDSKEDKKFSFNTTWHSFMNFEKEEKNMQMYEFHFGYRLTEKDKLEVKIATWKLFAPLGIQMWDSHFLKKSEYYPGRVLEYGIGLSYKRTLWKGLFAAVEVLPLKQEYLDVNDDKIEDGFRLYTSYHIGYHFSFFNNRVFIEPQIHCNYWPIMTKAPEEFRGVENRDWSKNYFLFEPNIYIGIKL